MGLTTRLVGILVQSACQALLVGVKPLGSLRSSLRRACRGRWAKRHPANGLRLTCAGPFRLAEALVGVRLNRWLGMGQPPFDSGPSLAGLPGGASAQRRTNSSIPARRPSGTSSRWPSPTPRPRWAAWWTRIRRSGRCSAHDSSATPGSECHGGSRDPSAMRVWSPNSTPSPVLAASRHQSGTESAGSAVGVVLTAAGAAGLSSTSS